MNTPAQADTLRRTRVIAANEALITAGLWHQPPPAIYGHAPYCPHHPCCCTQRWVRIERSAT